MNSQPWLCYLAYPFSAFIFSKNEYWQTYMVGKRKQTKKKHSDLSAVHVPAFTLKWKIGICSALRNGNWTCRVEDKTWGVGGYWLAYTWRSQQQHHHHHSHHDNKHIFVNTKSSNAKVYLNHGNPWRVGCWPAINLSWIFFLPALYFYWNSRIYGVKLCPQRS